MGVESNSGTADAREAVTWPSTEVAARLSPFRTDRHIDREGDSGIGMHKPISHNIT